MAMGRSGTFEFELTAKCAKESQKFRALPAFYNAALNLWREQYFFSNFTLQTLLACLSL